jgi:alpha-tubulin suppressor-like RCC1 family protein
MTTINKCGIWILEDVYKKTNLGYWTYCTNPPPPFVPGASLFVWGNNDVGQLGDETIIRKSSPVQIPGSWLCVRSDNGYVHAIKCDNTLWGWGNSRLSSIGRISSPVQIPGTTWCNLDVAQERAFAVKCDGTLWGWGTNIHGGLGDNTIISKSSPVQIPGTTWSRVKTLKENSFGLKTDGTLWSWGRNQYGEIGNNTITPRSSPVQIPGTWTSVGNEGYSTAAIKTDGTLWVWGNNFWGSLGIGDKTFKSSPTQIPGATWRNLDCLSNISARAHTASKSDNTLWIWGRGVYVQAENCLYDYLSSPVQLPGSWTGIASQGYGTDNYMIRTDNTLWAYGINGEDAAENRMFDVCYSSPIQIPGCWTRITRTNSTTYALSCGLCIT